MKDLLPDAQFIELYNYLASKERLGPGPARGRVICDHTLRYTVEWLKKLQIRDVRANIEKIMDLGGHCDCEVLLNVNPEIWKERRYEEIMGPDFLGKGEWEQFVTNLLYDSGYNEDEER
jgi:hypothetical protein